jgi:YtkA-like
MVFGFRRSGRVSPLPKEFRNFLWCACAVILCSTGCRKPTESSPTVTPTVKIEHEIVPDPPRAGSVVLNLRLADSASKAILGAHVAVEADMSHPGMAPVFADAQEVEPGRYQAHLTFAMAGDWVILLHITLPGGQKLERQIEVRGVRAN